MGFNEEQLLGAKTRNDLLAIAKKNNISVNKVLKEITIRSRIARTAIRISKPSKMGSAQ